MVTEDTQRAFDRGNEDNDTDVDDYRDFEDLSEDEVYEEYERTQEAIEDGCGKNNTEDDESRVIVTPIFRMDDVHAQAVSELRDADVDVEAELSQQLYQTVEQMVYELRQQTKYGGNR